MCVFAVRGSACALRITVLACSMALWMRQCSRQLCIHFKMGANFVSVNDDSVRVYGVWCMHVVHTDMPHPLARRCSMCVACVLLHMAVSAHSASPPWPAARCLHMCLRTRHSLSNGGHHIRGFKGCSCECVYGSWQCLRTAHHHVGL